MAKRHRRGRGRGRGLNSALLKRVVIALAIGFSAPQLQFAVAKATTECKHGPYPVDDSLRFRALIVKCGDDLAASMKHSHIVIRKHFPELAVELFEQDFGTWFIVRGIGTSTFDTRKVSAKAGDVQLQRPEWGDGEPSKAFAEQDLGLAEAGMR